VATFIFKAVINQKEVSACHALFRKVGLRFKYDERTRLAHSGETTATLRQSLLAPTLSAPFYKFEPFTLQILQHVLTWT
jgi:hypothetical protein